MNPVPRRHDATVGSSAQAPSPGMSGRWRRVAKLLTERERVVAAMDEIEAAMDVIGQ
mgnify:CR=1 FL=1